MTLHCHRAQASRIGGKRIFTNSLGDIYKKGCAADYPNAEHRGDDVVIVQEQDLDMELCFARAHVALKEWLVEYAGGY